MPRHSSPWGRDIRKGKIDLPANRQRCPTPYSWASPPQPALDEHFISLLYVKTRAKGWGGSQEIHPTPAMKNNLRKERVSGMHAARELDGIRGRVEQGKHWGSSGKVGKMRSAQAEAAPTPPPAPPAPPLCPFLINTVVYHSQVPCLNDSTAVIWTSGNPYNLGHAWL